MSSAQLLPKAIWLTILCLPAVTPSKHGSVTSTDLVTPGAERTSESEREILNVDFDRRRDQAVEIGAAAFSTACTSELLSPAVTSDTLISQTEFANFILNYCISQQVCRRGEQLTYGDLPIALQLAFVNPNCQAPHCNPDTSAAQFGYLYTPATQTAVETSIGQLCDTIYPLAGDFVAATPRPSFTPPIPPTPPSPPVPFVPTPPVPFVPTPPSGVTRAPVVPPTGGNQPIPFQPTPFVPTPGNQPTPFVPTPPTPPTPPVTSAPVTPAPVTSAPVTAAPVTPSPITSAPTKAPPTPVPVAPIPPIPAPVAPIPAPIAPIPAPVAPVPAPVAPVKAPVAPVPAPVAPIPVTASPVAPVSAPTGPVAAMPIPVAPIAPTRPVQPVTPAPITPAPTTTSPSASPSMAQSAGPSASPSQARNPAPTGPSNGGTPPLSIGGIIALSLAGAASAFMLFSLFGAYWFSILCRRRGTRKAAAAVDDDAADDAPGGDDVVQDDVEAGSGGGGNGGGASSPVVASREIAPASPEAGGTSNEAEGTAAATPAEAMELQLAPSNSPPLFKIKDTFAWEPSPKPDRPSTRNFFGNLFRPGREKTQKKKRENVKFSATVVVEPKAKSSDEAVTASEPDVPLIPELFTPVKTREKEPVKPPEEEPDKPPEKEPVKPPEKEPVKTAEKEDIPSTEVADTAGQGDSTSTDTDPSTGIEVVSGLSGHIAAGGAVSTADVVRPSAGLVAGAAAGATTVAAVGAAATVASSKKTKETKKKKDKTEKKRWGRKKKGEKEDAGAEDDAGDDANKDDEPDTESTKRRRRWGRKQKGEKGEAVEETKDEAEDAGEGDKASEVSGSPRRRLLGRVTTARRKLKYEAGDDEAEDAAEDAPSKRGVLGRVKKSSGRKLKKSPSLRSAASGDESKDEDEENASQETGSSSKRGLLGRVRKPSLRKMKKTKSSASLADSESKAGSSAATIGEMEGVAGEEGKKSGRKWKGFLRMRNKMGVQLDDEKPMVPPGTIGGEDPGDAMREAVARGDWRRVQDLSMQMEVANVTEGKKPAASLPVSDPKVSTDDEQTVGSLRGQLDQAVATSNWSVAEALSAEILSTSAARKAKAKQDAAAEPPSDGPTDQAKIDTINGLIKDGNWKLVSSLSSVYGLDTALEQPVGLEGTTTTGDAASIASGITEDSSGNVEITVKNPYTKSMMEPPKLDDQSLSSVSTENQTEKEIERLVANKDWKGLAEFTAQEDEDEADEVDFSVPK